MCGSSRCNPCITLKGSRARKGYQMTKQTKQQQSNNMERKFAVDHAVEWIDVLIANQEWGLRQLKDRRASFIAATKEAKPSCSLSTQIGFVVNDVQNIQRNYRLDLAGNHAAALALTERK